MTLRRNLFLIHPARDLAPPLVVALAGDHALAAATVHPRKLTAVLLSLRRVGHPLHQALEIARLVGPGLCRVQTARAKDLRVVPTAAVLCPHELVRRVYRLQSGEGDTRSAPSSGFAVAPGRGRTPGLPFPRSTGDGDSPNEGACCCSRNHATGFAARTRRSCRPAIRARWTCPSSRCRATRLARSSTSRRRNILWIFGFDFLFQFRLVRHALPAVLDLWLCNLRLHSRRFRGRRCLSRASGERRPGVCSPAPS